MSWADPWVQLNHFSNHHPPPHTTPPHGLMLPLTIIWPGSEPLTSNTPNLDDVIVKSWVLHLSNHSEFPLFCFFSFSLLHEVTQRKSQLTPHFLFFHSSCQSGFFFFCDRCEFKSEVSLLLCAKHLSVRHLIQLLHNSAAEARGTRLNVSFHN